MTNKAFIFDMDGVLINSEPVWERYEQVFLAELIGRNKYFRIRDQLLGSSVNTIYEITSKHGLKISMEELVKIYDEYARLVYSDAFLTPGIGDLIEKLLEKEFQLGLVSSSRQSWIDLVLKKLKAEKKFKYLISLQDTQNILPKPSPMGYQVAIKVLGAKPSTTAILEDSNKGVQAAKKSGAFTICLKENLPLGYLPKGADLYIETIKDFTDRLEELLQL